MIGRLNGINNIYGAKMDITLIVGNGFDLALGLKTSYRDFYDWLKNEHPVSTVSYIEEMKNDIFDHCENWADYEKGLGEYSKRIDNEDLVQCIYPWKAEVVKILKDYLKGLDTSKQVSECLDFYNSLRSAEFLKSVLWGQRLFHPNFWNGKEANVSLHTVSLNYTDSLDQIVNKIGMFQDDSSSLKIDENVLHPHGTLESNIIVGVYNETQILNGEIKNINHFKRLFIKNQLVSRRGNESIQEDKENAICVINKSQIVCLYGVSLGETDTELWILLAKWLLEAEGHQLLIFCYSKDGTEKEEAIQDKFLNCLPPTLTEKEKGELKSRIFVSFHKRGYLFESQFTPVEGKDCNVFLDGTRKMPMIWIKPGDFTMGSPGKPKPEEGRDDDEELHSVELTRGYWLGQYEVTQAQWKAVMKTDLRKQIKICLSDQTKYDYLGNKTWREHWETDDVSRIIYHEGDDVPVYYVNWEEAMEFCRKLTEQERKAGRLPKGYMYTLPTEAQWEYACRAGTKTALYNGDIQILGENNAPALDAIAWYGGNSSQEYQGARGADTKSWKEKQYPGGMAGMHEVGKKLPNAWGLYDMLGNVWEWCSDWYGEYPEGKVKDPTGPENGRSRVCRGGSWCSGAGDCRAASRRSLGPSGTFIYLGFRVALAPGQN